MEQLKSELASSARACNGISPRDKLAAYTGQAISQGFGVILRTKAEKSAKGFTEFHRRCGQVRAAPVSCLNLTQNDIADPNGKR